MRSRRSAIPACRQARRDPRSAIFRIIDANTNRAVEGLRVMEEIVRLVVEQKTITRQLKDIRQKLRKAAQDLIVGAVTLKHREAGSDVGRKIYTKREAKRSTINDVFAANAKRVQEALRVLEEFSKLVDTKTGKAYKALRFKIYTIEKKISPRLVNQEN